LCLEKVVRQRTGCLKGGLAPILSKSASTFNSGEQTRERAATRYGTDGPTGLKHPSFRPWAGLPSAIHEAALPESRWRVARGLPGSRPGTNEGVIEPETDTAPKVLTVDAPAVCDVRRRCLMFVEAVEARS